MTREHVLLDDILDAVLVEESEPTYAALIRWSARYPEHGEALAEFFATWAVQAELPQETAADEERLASLTVSHALNILHERDVAAKHEPKASSATPRLIATARAAGVSEEQLADRIGLDVGIVQKLDLHRITDIPRACFERLARVLMTASDRVREMTTGPALVAAGTRYKAKKRPFVTTEHFADAIRTSSLAEEAKRYWLDVVDAEAVEHNR